MAEGSAWGHLVYRHPGHHSSWKALGCSSETSQNTERNTQMTTVLEVEQPTSRGGGVRQGAGLRCSMVLTAESSEKSISSRSRYSGASIFTQHHRPQQLEERRANICHHLNQSPPSITIMLQVTIIIVTGSPASLLGPRKEHEGINILTHPVNLGCTFNVLEPNHNSKGSGRVR